MARKVAEQITHIYLQGENPTLLRQFANTKGYYRDDRHHKPVRQVMVPSVPYLTRDSCLNKTLFGKGEAMTPRVLNAQGGEETYHLNLKVTAGSSSVPNMFP